MGENPQDTLKLRCHRRLRLEFHEARMTSDAERRTGIDGVASTYLRENPVGHNVQQELVPLLRQSVDSPLAGYGDTNDAVRLARDPAMQAVVGPRALM